VQNPKAFLTYLPNKHEVEVKGNEAPSVPFLLITTILANNIFLHSVKNKHDMVKHIFVNTEKCP